MAYDSFFRFDDDNEMKYNILYIAHQLQINNTMMVCVTRNSTRRPLGDLEAI